MNDNILNIIMLVFFFFMIIIPVYMILKSFFSIVGYMKIVSENEEKKNNFREMSCEIQKWVQICRN